MKPPNSGDKPNVVDSAKATLFWVGGASGVKSASDAKSEVDPRAKLTTMGWYSELPLSSANPLVDAEAPTVLLQAPLVQQPLPEQLEAAQTEKPPLNAVVIDAAELEPPPAFVDPPLPSWGEPPSVPNTELTETPRRRRVWLALAGAGTLMAVGLGAVFALLVLSPHRQATPAKEPAPSVVSRSTPTVSTPASQPSPQRASEEEKTEKLASLEREVKTLAAQIADKQREAAVRTKAAAKKKSRKPSLRIHYDRKNNVVDVWLPPGETALPTVQVKRRPEPKKQDSE